MRVNGWVVARTQGRRLPMSCPSTRAGKPALTFPFFGIGSNPTGFVISIGAVPIMRVWVFASTRPQSLYEGRLNRSSPYPSSRIHFESGPTGSKSPVRPGGVSVRFRGTIGQRLSPQSRSIEGMVATPPGPRGIYRTKQMHSLARILVARTSDHIETFKTRDDIRTAYETVRRFYQSKRIRVNNTEMVADKLPTTLQFTGGKFFGGGNEYQTHDKY